MSNDKPVFIVEGVQVYADGKPVVQEPAQTSTPAGGEELEKLRADLTKEQERVTRLLDIKEALTQDRDEFKRQVEAGRQDLAKASEDHRLTLERLLAESKQRVAALDLAKQERDDAQAQVSTLTQKVAALEGRKVLPEDALERIKKVSGVADKYAQPILDALTAPASPPSE